MMKNLKKRDGFTLIEILIASTIFVMVVGVGVATYSSSSGFQSKSAVIRETNQEARYTMDTIVRDIKSADASVQYIEPIVPVGSNKYVFNGFAFVQSGSFVLGNNPATPYDHIKIYKKGTGNCSPYVQEIAYMIDTTNNTINQDIDYFVHTDPNDLNSPANYDLISGRPDPATGCVPSSAMGLLSNRVQLTNVGANTFFQGIQSFSKNDTVQNTVSPYLKISLDIKPANSDSNSSEENRVIQLQTTVVPRLMDY